MALRFRRRFRLAPGVHLNVGLGGSSLSVGPRGFTTTFGRRGTFLNASIPGTGLSARSRLDHSGGAPDRPRRDVTNPGKITVSATIRVEGDGSVHFLDADGKPLPPEWVDRAKKQAGDQIKALIQESCDKVNARVESLGTIHIHTPAPTDQLKYVPLTFSTLRPIAPELQGYGFWARIFKPLRGRIDAANARASALHRENLREWEEAKAAHEDNEAGRKQLLEELVYVNVEAMEGLLQQALEAIHWPRETNVSAEVRDDGGVVLLDVDLPEIEDLPKTTASVPARGYRLSVKELSPMRVQKLYMAHVHGIGFRIIGEVFAVLPRSREVVLSAFSQRPDKATGGIRDEYLYSVRVTREAWSRINFGNLDSLDAVVALSQFDLRRDMTKAGKFNPIEPFVQG